MKEKTRDLIDRPDAKRRFDMDTIDRGVNRVNPVNRVKRSIG